VAFGNFVVELAKQNNYDFIVPVFEEVFALSKVKNELQKYSKVLLNEFDAYMQLHNKGRLNAVCEEHNIQTPKTYNLTNLSQLDEARNGDQNFPVFLKWPVSCGSAGVTKISNKEQLEAELSALENNIPDDLSLAPVLQQGINGYQIATQSVYKDGELYDVHMYRNIAEFPVGSGTGVVRESIYHEGIKQEMIRMGKALQYNGLLGLDFIIDDETNQAYLIDANPRLPLGFHNSQRAGAHLTEAYIHSIEGKKYFPQAYREKVRTRALAMHLYSVIGSLLKFNVNPLKVAKTYIQDRKNAFGEIADKGDLVPGLMVPWILIRAQFNKGDGAINKFQDGAVFNDESFVKIAA
jgi:predicted ATP-grasp superfamily ATP-dependent carboligase